MTNRNCSASVLDCGSLLSNAVGQRSQDCRLHAGSPMPHSFIQHILLPHAEPSLLSLKTHSFLKSEVQKKNNKLKKINKK